MEKNERMCLLMTLFLTQVTIYMSAISNSPQSISTINNLMKWIIGCIFFMFFSFIEYGIVLLCRFVFEYKTLPEDYAKKQLMQMDMTCLIISSISFTLYIIVYFASTI